MPKIVLTKKSSLRAISKTKKLPYGPLPKSPKKREESGKKHALAAEDLMFNGKLSNDRVLFRMLVGKQIVGKLIISKFHRVMDQNQFFQCLGIVLGKKETGDRIDLLMFGNLKGGRQSVTPKALKLLLSGMWENEESSIKELIFANVQIRDDHIKVFKTLLANKQVQQNCKLETLTIRSNFLTDEGALELAQIIDLHLPSLKNINIAENQIGDEGLAILLQSCKTSPIIRKITLGGNIFRDFGLISQFMREQPTTSRLRTISLIKSKLEDDHVVEMIKVLEQNNRITNLNLMYNSKLSRQVLLAVSTLVSINQHIQSEKKFKKELIEQKSKIVELFFQKKAEKERAIEYLRLQEPPEVLELLILRLMKQLAELELKLNEMSDLISSTGINLSKERSIQKVVMYLQKSEKRMKRALSVLFPQVENDGFANRHQDRYAAEVEALMDRDEKLQSDIERMISMLTQRKEALEKELSSTIDEEEQEKDDQTERKVSNGQDAESGQVETQSDVPENSSASQSEGLTSEKKSDTPSEVHTGTAEIDQEKDDSSSEGEAKHSDDEKIETDEEIDLPSPLRPRIDPLNEEEKPIVTNIKDSLANIDHRLFRLNKALTRIQDRWKVISLDELEVDEDLKQRCIEMKIKVNAQDSLDLFNTMKERYLSPKNEVQEELERLKMENETLRSELGYLQPSDLSEKKENVIEKQNMDDE